MPTSVSVHQRCQLQVASRKLVVCRTVYGSSRSVFDGADTDAQSEFSDATTPQGGAVVVCFHAKTSAGFSRRAPILLHLCRLCEALLLFVRSSVEGTPLRCLAGVKLSEHEDVGLCSPRFKRWKRVSP